MQYIKEQNEKEELIKKRTIVSSYIFRKFIQEDLLDNFPPFRGFRIISVEGDFGNLAKEFDMDGIDYIIKNGKTTYFLGNRLQYKAFRTFTIRYPAEYNRLVEGIENKNPLLMTYFLEAYCIPYKIRGKVLGSTFYWAISKTTDIINNIVKSQIRWTNPPEKPMQFYYIN